MSDADLSPMAPTDVPATYPRHLEQWVTTPKGDRIFIRPIVPEDVARIEYAFAHADLDTIRARFFTGAPPTDRAHLEYLANVDYDHRLALLGMDEEGTSIGVARYEQESPTSAEIAIVVNPDWRRRGIASILVEALEAPGRENGFEKFRALYLPSNKGVERMLMSIGYAHPELIDDIACLTKPLV